MIARELTEFFAPLRAGRRPGRPARATDDPGFLSNVNACYRARRARGDPLPRRRATPRTRPFGARPARRRLGEGLPPGRRRAARARLRAGAVHAPLLRRVPRAARDDRPRRAVRRALDGCATSDARSPPTAAGWPSRTAGSRARAGPRARALHHGGGAGLLRARLARATHCRRRCSARSRSRAARRRRRTAPAEPAPAPCRAATRWPPQLRTTSTSDRGASAAQGPAPLLDPQPGMAERERLHVAVVISAVPARQRRAHSIFQIAAAARAARAHRLDLAPSTRRAGTEPSGPPSCGRAIREHFAPIAGPGVQGLRQLVRRRRRASPPAGRPRTRALLLPAAARGPTWSTTTSRSSTRPRWRRRWAEETYPLGLPTSARARGSPTSCTSATADCVGLFGFGVDHAVYRPRPTSRGGATRSSSTRATSPRGARCRSACSPSRSCTPPPGATDPAVRRRPARSTRRSPTSTSASPRQTSSRGSTPRRPSGSACR